MKSFQERNPLIIGAIAVAVVVAVCVAALNYTRLPFLSSGSTYAAYFDEAGGLVTGAPVQVSGFKAGQVKSISLDSQGVLVTFTVADGIRLGERTEASINTISLLGNKVLEVTPRGAGHLSGAIPMQRTTSPYQLPDALGDLTATISGLNTDQLSSALQTLSDTLRDTPPQLKIAVEGVARFSQTLDARDAQLRNLLANASKATTVLGQRTDQIVQLVHDTNAVLAALHSQSAALEEISANISALAQQIRGFIGENRATLKPALDKLNGVLATIDNRKTEVQQSIKGLSTYALSFGESIASGPFFKLYVANLEEILILALASFGVSAQRLPSHPGVWVGDEKIASIGVRIDARAVTHHGFALNVNTDLTFFRWIVPCGIVGKSVTSLSRILGRALPLREVAEIVADCFGKVFRMERVRFDSASEALVPSS